MNLLPRLKAEGIHLAISKTGNLEATGDPKAIEKVLSLLREHKAELIAALKAPKRNSMATTTLGYRCPCGSISYLPRAFQWKDLHGGKHWGFSCLGCSTRYWMV